ncbi:hypothetical protein [Caldimonas sp. KR1-144]|uniref:hypothetical protein n=1 Tax=Caldimonas sp. KR1-144 TaxID=3400911 RepID=UPI003C0AE9C4
MNNTALIAFADLQKLFPAVTRETILEILKRKEITAAQEMKYGMGYARWYPKQTAVAAVQEYWAARNEIESETPVEPPTPAALSEKVDQLLANQEKLGRMMASILQNLGVAAEA